MGTTLKTLPLTVEYDAEAEVIERLASDDLPALAKALDEGASITAVVVRTKIDKVRTGA